MPGPKKNPDVEVTIVPGRATGVVKLPSGEWVARIYSIDENGRATIEKETTPDLRAVAIERMQVFAAQLFLL